MDSFEMLRPLPIGLFLAYIAYRILYRLVLWPQYFSPLRHVPTPPVPWTLVGHLPILYRDDGTAIKNLVNQLGPVIRLVGPIGFENLILVQAEHLHRILVEEWFNYPKPEFVRHALGTIVGYGLLTVEGNDHRLMRKALNPAFSLSSLRSQIDAHHYCTDALVKIFNDQIIASEMPHLGKVIPVYGWICKSTFDIICETGFRYKADSLHNPHNRLEQAYHELQSIASGSNFGTFNLIMMIPGVSKLLRNAWLYRHNRWLPLPGFLCFVRTMMESFHKIKAESSKLFQEKINDASTGTEGRKITDIISILIRARKADLEAEKTEYTMSDQDMIEQALSFLGAGHETTAAGITWTLWLLANDQESQLRLREEVTSVLQTNPHPDYPTLRGLQWLDCVIMESLRIFPPIPVTMRVASKTGYVGDILVPQGTLITIPIRTINMLKDVWGDDAEEFKPSRWLKLPKGYDPRYLKFSFLTGPHTCIAKTMALMELKATVASLITNFTFEPAYKGQVASSTMVMSLKPTDGVPLLIKRVDATSGVSGLQPET